METWENWEDALLDDLTEVQLPEELHDEPESILLLLLAMQAVYDVSFDLDIRQLRLVNRLLSETVNGLVNSLGPWETDELMVKSTKKAKPPTHLPLSLIAKCPRVTKLSMSMVSLTSLDGIPSRIQTLWLYNSSIHDLSPLSSCSMLLELDISSTDVIDLAGLEGCSSLQSLECDGSKVSDITALSCCKALTSLGLYRTFVDDLSPLTALPSLNALNVSELDDLRDLSPISKLLTLTKLILSDCRDVKGIRTLSTLTRLEHLNINGLQMDEDDNNLPNLPSLIFLDASHSNIPSLSPLSACQSMEILECRSCVNVFDLQPLTSCTSLQELDLSSTDVEDITDLSACLLLTTLNLPETVIVGVTILPRLKHLSTLCLSGVDSDDEFTDLILLSSCSSLHTLDVSSCISLTSLIFSNPTGSSYPPLGSVLEDFNASYCSNLASLWSGYGPELTALTSLDVSHCPLKDLLPLSLCTRLIQLDCSGCEEIKDLPLLPLLKSLRCSQTAISTLQQMPLLSWVDQHRPPCIFAWDDLLHVLSPGSRGLE